MGVNKEAIFDIIKETLSKRELIYTNFKINIPKQVNFHLIISHR